MDTRELHSALGYVGNYFNSKQASGLVIIQGFVSIC